MPAPSALHPPHNSGESSPIRMFSVWGDPVFPDSPSEKLRLDGLMAHRKYGRYTPELRADALRRVAVSGKSIVKVAEEIGVDHRTLWKWVNDAKLETIDPTGELTPAARKRIRDLEKENARLARDLDFEKKARAFFRERDQNENGSN